MTRRVVLYGRPDCHLCDEAREALEPIVVEAGDIELEEIDIERDEELLHAYLERIPVITLEGETVSELVPDPGRLRAILLNSSTP